MDGACSKNEAASRKCPIKTSCLSYPFLTSSKDDNVKGHINPTFSADRYVVAIDGLHFNLR